MNDDYNKTYSVKSSLKEIEKLIRSVSADFPETIRIPQLGDFYIDKIYKTSPNFISGFGYIGQKPAAHRGPLMNVSFTFKNDVLTLKPIPNPYRSAYDENGFDDTTGFKAVTPTSESKHMKKNKTFAERLDEAIKLVKEDNDIVQMCTPEYAHGLEKDSMEPSQGTVRSPKKEWFGGRPSGKKAEDMSKANSKNTEGGFKK